MGKECGSKEHSFTKQAMRAVELDDTASGCHSLFVPGGSCQAQISEDMWDVFLIAVLSECVIQSVEYTSYLSCNKIYAG